MADEESTAPAPVSEPEASTTEAPAESQNEPLVPSAPPLPAETEVVFTPSPSLVPTRQGCVLEPLPPNIFGRVPENCVTFCIDTSGSMFRALDVVKEHLVETLKNMAVRDDQHMFNLIEFNSQVTRWADKMVNCTPETVEVARQWINNLSAKTGTNTQDALLTALADPACEAIYLVSDCLPDQYPDDVLDRVVSVCGRRCVHCIYVTGETADEATTEFFEDLAVETFGSLHIVTLTTHGCVERVTPIYRSDHTHERIVHTVNNTLRPTIKTCSVAHTLNADPVDVFTMAPRVAALGYPPCVYPPALYGSFPHRYYYPYYWSRYRPAKAWLNAQGDSGDLYLSPAAATLLVGKRVIARRMDDGYFYRATVQSQVVDEKFLVAFGPCKHGKYRQTVYQDTYVYDIVDYYDALRHTIITGDRVLAPFEPEGERFAPGIVLEGHEKRQAEGPDDQMLTVSFSNGKTEKVPMDIAVWIPATLYERLALELQMPKAARESLLKDADNYPLENLPGYPESGALAEPKEYPRANPLVIESNPYVWDPYLYRYPPFLPYGHPGFVVSHRSERQEKYEPPKYPEPEAVIPGTDMTRQELDRKVLSLLKEHTSGRKVEEQMKESKASETSTESIQSTSRLLDRRIKQDENLLKKSVTFSEQDTYEDSSSRDEFLDDSQFDEYGNPSKYVESGVNTDSSLLFYRSPGIRRRPPWNYWRNDPSPSYSDISGGISGSVRSSSPGPFRETALQAPLEARDQREPPYNVEWTSPAFKYVDTFAKHDYSNSIGECLNPQPPARRKPEKVSRNYTVQSKPVKLMTAEEREDARRALRRRRVIAREEAWQARLADEDHMKALMQDQHRERIMQQMERDRLRQLQEQEDIQRAREGKKKITKELRARIEKNQLEEEQKENRRIEALRQRRERREDIAAQREKEIEDTVKRREEIRKQNSDARLKAWTEKLDNQDAQDAALLKQHQEAKLKRNDKFRELERRGQERKDLRLAVKERNQATYISQIFA